MQSNLTAAADRQHFAPMELLKDEFILFSTNITPLWG
jgi:hypothetical protein